LWGGKEKKMTTIELAKIFLKNADISNGSWVIATLEGYIEDSNSLNNKELKSVFEAILQDGYDIGEFSLVDSFPDGYCFGTRKSSQNFKCFDVYTKWDDKKQIVIGYAELDDAGCFLFFKAFCIEEAVKKFDWLNSPQN
jgi:hypothetical protein